MGKGKRLLSMMLVATLFFGVALPVSAMETSVSSRIKAVNLNADDENSTESVSGSDMASDELSNSKTPVTVVTNKGIKAKKLVDLNADDEAEEITPISQRESAVSDADTVISDSRFHWFRYANGNRGCRDENGEIIKDGYAISDSGNLCYLDEKGELSLKENQAVASSFPKKGLQGNYILTVPGVTGNHILMNLYMNDAVSASPTELSYNIGGNTYYFNAALYDMLRGTISQAQSRNVKVSIVLLLRGSETLAAMDAMYAGVTSTNSNQFYAFNPDSEVVKAFFGFSAMYLSSGGYHVDHWILGNEVNMPNTYNYTGSVDTKLNTDLYAKTFFVCDELIRVHDTTSSIYISLDNHWTDNLNGYGIAGKDFLNEFFLTMESEYPDVKWNIAYHPYAPVLFQTSSIWRNPELNTDENATKFITPANLSVLTEYVKNRISPDCRIILSEQGYDSHEGEHIQAQGLAYCFAAAENDPMIDAVIFRTYMDEGTEGFLDLALVDQNGHEREAFAVYQAMETPIWENIKGQYIQ